MLGSAGILSTGLSKTLVVTMLVASGGLAAAGAATNLDTLAPMVRGHDGAFDRGLSRDTHALGLRLVRIDEDDHAQPIIGADVTITHPHSDRAAHKQTNDHGGVLFRLPTGTYTVHITDGDTINVTRDVALRDDIRVAIAFDAHGQPHVFRAHQRDVAQHDGLHILHIAARQATENDTHEPLVGATVTIDQATRDSDAPARVAENHTDDRGVAVFRLHPGHYRITITHGEATTQHWVRLDANHAIGFFLDAQGTWHTRTADRPHGDQGDAVHLGVTTHTATGRAVADAHVTVYRIDRETDQRHAVARGLTNDRGLALFTLEPGDYEVEATHGDLSGTGHVRLAQDTRLPIELS